MSSSNPLPNKDTEMAEQLHDDMFDVLNCYEIDARDIQDSMTYIGSDEAEKIIKQILPRLQALINSEVDRKSIERVIAEMEALRDSDPIFSPGLVAGQVLNTRIASLTSKEPS